MTTFLLTWNPKRFPFDDLKDVVESIASSQPESISWSCGNTKSIVAGDRVFMLRQGVEPRGIMASGWVTRGSYEEEHWNDDRADKGEKATYVDFIPDVFLDPEAESPLDVRQFADGPLAEVNWRTQASGISLRADAAAALSEAWLRHLGKPLLDLGAVPTEMEGTEGEVRLRIVAHRSRERALRDAKLAEVRAASVDGRLRCSVPGCAFDFEEIYGELGAGFAQVHHLLPLADAVGPRPTRLIDLAVVCANCHAMIHRGGECRPIEKLIASPSPYPATVRKTSASQRK